MEELREEGVSIFVTGSNSYLLGGELATKLTGRHVEFDLFPLSFREWLDMRAFLGKPSVADRNAAFAEYVRSGGLPKTLEFDDPEARETYVESVVEQILHKDVRRRFKSDAEALRTSAPLRQGARHPRRSGGVNVHSESLLVKANEFEREDRREAKAGNTSIGTQIVYNVSLPAYLQPKTEKVIEVEESK